MLLTIPFSRQGSPGASRKPEYVFLPLPIGLVDHPRSPTDNLALGGDL
jgi:hypothetical protein